MAQSPDRAHALLSIGECMVELSPAGDGSYRRAFAGDTFNMLWHARRALPATVQTGYLTAVGDDATSRDMLVFMAQHGIATDRIATIPGAAPGLYMISLDQGERSFSYWRDTSAARRLADDNDRLAHALAAADTIFFSGITLAILDGAARSRLLACLGRAKAAGKTVAFDSNLRPSLWPDAQAMRAAITEAARVTTLALPTVPDEATLFGEADAEAVARRYRAAGVREVVVKAGPDPALVWLDDRQWRIGPAAAITPVDTTGAGDSFNGAYVAARILGATPDSAAAAAHLRAGQVIRQHGALVDGDANGNGAGDHARRLPASTGAK